MPLLTRFVALVAAGAFAASGRCRTRKEGCFFSVMRRCRLDVLFEEVLAPIICCFIAVLLALVVTVLFYDMAKLRWPMIELKGGRFVKAPAGETTIGKPVLSRPVG